MKTKKIIAGIGIVALSMGLAGCGDVNNASANRPSKPMDNSCKDWEFDEQSGTWYCDDSKSNRYGSYYHNGGYYSNKSALTSSSAYQSYKQSSSFAGKTSSFSKGSSGFGSSSISTGG